MQTPNTEAANQSQSLGSLPQLVSKQNLAVRIDVSLASLDRWANDPNNIFPAPLKIGPNRVAWTEKSIADWLDAVAAQGGKS